MKTQAKKGIRIKVWTEHDLAGEYSNGPHLVYLRRKDRYADWTAKVLVERTGDPVFTGIMENSAGVTQRETVIRVLEKVRHTNSKTQKK